MTAMPRSPVERPGAYVLQDARCRDHKVARILKDSSGSQVFDLELPDTLRFIPFRGNDAMAKLDVSVQLVLPGHTSEIF